MGRNGRFSLLGAWGPPEGKRPQHRSFVLKSVEVVWASDHLPDLLMYSQHVQAGGDPDQEHASGLDSAWGMWCLHYLTCCSDHCA